MKHRDVIIIGGGLAGLTAALHMASEGLDVLVLEKHAYPRHKVCGEYLSNEVQPYFQHLGIDLPKHVAINRLQLTTLKGYTLPVSLPLGGMGISRYTLDATLYQLAKDRGLEVRIETVTEIDYTNPGFRIRTNRPVTYFGSVVIGAYGKRAGLDRELNRSFMNQRAPWLAVKAHYAYPEWPDDQVGLFAFRGGYAGLSKTEDGSCNLCYLARYESFRPYGSIENFNKSVLNHNPWLDTFFSRAQMLFKDPLTIAQIAFGKKAPIVHHMLMCGDTAGMIHPLCGNGMAMAIHSGKIASELICKHLSGVTYSHEALEKDYRKSWQEAFSRRLAVGRRLQRILLNEKLSNLALEPLARFPWLLRGIIRNTHGKPIAV